MNNAISTICEELGEGMKRTQLFVDLKMNRKTGPFSDLLREMIQTFQEDGYAEVEVSQEVKIDNNEYLIIFNAMANEHNE
ncbi:hypothetical protein BAG01nite_13710 [Brevibacillus agri]|uniref:Uncharacterized protein n=1 Tax=Brevibacillus agri TaxID=51101 RepID=A0A3M8AU68_9BACL|nr:MULTISPECIES: hypothetical protein [Brevibacillus]EJL41933.1 hypothetical protein PMI08_03521 [Brevibacillus sp. CF112]MDN4096050.1 hypothetical protein [Brevibacillus agri]MED1822574.1 hypothetical protein [Brevibacillus agri]MED3497675.1 hypothetical protein [Brevibacillus agri]QAV13163.1 hypothetical protein BA6348_10625 [Brevibacillus agri]